MRDEGDVAKSPGSESGTPAGAVPGEPPARQPVQRYSEPFFVELAWLVIEGAVVLRRLRALLARI